MVCLQGALRIPMELSAEHKAMYDRDGCLPLPCRPHPSAAIAAPDPGLRRSFVLVPGVFTHEECDAFVAHAVARKEEQMAHVAATPDEPLPAREREPAQTDPEMDMILHPKIRDALSDCMDVDGWPAAEPVAIQAMYFWQGSEQRRHQDQFYLPECMSGECSTGRLGLSWWGDLAVDGCLLRTAWTAFEDVSPRNGTVWAQAGSHKGRLLTKSDFEEGAEFDKVDYNDGVDTIFAENEAAGMKEVPVIAKKGDVLYFHGCLIHRGGKIEEPGSSRHVFANHYVPSTFDGEQPDRRGAGTAAQCPPPARSRFPGAAPADPGFLVFACR